MFGIFANGQQTAMHFGVQCFHPAIHHFREAGDVRDIGHREAGLLDGSGGSAGGHQLETTGGEAPGEVNQTVLVGYAEQGTGHGVWDSGVSVQTRCPGACSGDCLDRPPVDA
mgnify:CR=1 FL=1